MQQHQSLQWKKLKATTDWRFIHLFFSQTVLLTSYWVLFCGKINPYGKHDTSRLHTLTNANWTSRVAQNLLELKYYSEEIIILCEHFSIELASVPATAVWNINGGGRNLEMFGFIISNSATQNTSLHVKAAWKSEYKSTVSRM